MTTVAQVRLGDFCQTGSGSTPSRSEMARYYEGGHIPWVKSGELRESVITQTEEYVTDEALANTSVKLVPAGAILLAMYGATVGRLGVLGVQATTNQAVCHIVPDPERADAKYLFHALAEQVPRIIAKGVGGAQPNINQGLVKELLVPLPSLAEQKRIAAILDQAESLRAKRRAALEQLDALAQAIFIEMFGEPHSNSLGWSDAERLGDVAEVVSGVTKGRPLKSTSSRVVPYLAVANIQDRRLALSNVKEIEASEEEISRYRLRVGDLLLTEGGDPDKLGRGSLWNGEIEDCIHQNHVFRVRLKVEHIRPLFLNWLVGSQRGKRYFLKSAKQTTGIASINMGQLKQFPLLTPPLELQLKFEQRLERLTLNVAMQRKSLAELDALFASLQHRAFRGEL